MRIIIAGAGEVGFHLAKLLAKESLDIVLIDTDKERLQTAENYMDIQTLHGDGTSFKVLKEANVSKAGLFIAVTSSEDTNLTATILAKKFGAKKTIARISNLEYLIDKDVLDLSTVGVDELISPESLAAREIKRLLKESAFTDSFEFEGGKLSMVGVTLDEHAPIIGKTLIETAHLNPGQEFITVAIHRNSETLIPYGSTKFHLHDHAYFIVSPEGINHLLKFTGKKRVGIKNVMILGGSRTGQHAARRLSDLYNIKLIEENREKAFYLAEILPNTLVIQGDGTNVTLLEQEDIDQMDAFVALTGNSETNILSCLVAKNHGVKKTIALVENIDYIHLSQSIGIDTMINKKLIAANFIFRYIRKGDIVSLTGIHGVDAEIVEFIVKPGSKVTRKKIKELNFPKTGIIGGVIRNSKGYITLGDFQVQDNDRVVVFSLTDSMNEVESFFN